MSVAAVIPWWPGTTCEWRNRWRSQAHAYWEALGYKVVTGYGREGEAINDGVRKTTAGVVVVPMADSVVSPGRVAQAVGLARKADGLVVPHDRYVYLSRAASETLTLQRVGLGMDAADRYPHEEGEVEFEGDRSVGGVVVFSRATWDAVGGYDAKLVRAYDGAFALATGTLVAPMRRLPGDFVHLWHPREPDEDPPETWETMRRYHEAAEAGPRAMRSLLEQRAAA